MKKIIFISCYIVFFIFMSIFMSCSDGYSEEDEDTSTVELFDGEEETDIDLSDISEEVGTFVADVCKGEGYTIYSYDQCLEATGPQIVENKVPQQSRPVDILFIVNSSMSMHYYLAYLTSESRFKKRFKHFLSIMTRHNIDWRLLFTNTQYREGWFFDGRNGEAMNVEERYGKSDLKYLEYDAPDCLNTFMYTITNGPDRSYEKESNTNYICSYPPYCGNSRPLSALKASFETNKHLTRKEANFVAVIVSNTDEEKTDVTADNVISEFRSVYGPDKRLSVLSLIIVPGDTECYKKNEDRTFLFFQTWQKGDYGNKVAELAMKTGGGNFSICLEDYSILAKTIVRQYPPRPIVSGSPVQ